MKKLMNVVFNILIYSMLLWSIASAVYVSLPEQYQELFPQFNWLTALISGGSTALLGTGGLVIKTILSKAQNEADSKFYLLSKNYLELKEAYHDIKKELNLKNDEIINATNRNNLLLETELKTKLDNPMLTEKARELIEGVLSE